MSTVFVVRGGARGGSLYSPSLLWINEERVRLREIGSRERDREGEGAGMGYHPSPGQGGSVDPGARVHRIRH